MAGSAGRLVLGVAGALIGSYFGQPSLGWAIGSAIGGAVFPNVIESQGPRLNDLRVMTANYGTFIPEHFGTFRAAGLVIDASEKRETAITEETGGKGGDSQESTSFSYDIDLYILLGRRGPISGIRKIWANEDVIWENTETTTVEGIFASEEMSGGFRVIRGDGTEAPSAIFEALHGSGEVPAYMNLPAIEFKRFKLDKWGGQVPNITVEIVMSQNEQVTAIDLGSITPTNYYPYENISDVFAINLLNDLKFSSPLEWAIIPNDVNGFIREVLGLYQIPQSVTYHNGYGWQPYQYGVYSSTFNINAIGLTGTFLQNKFWIVGISGFDPDSPVPTYIAEYALDINSYGVVRHTCARPIVRPQKFNTSFAVATDGGTAGGILGVGTFIIGGTFNNIYQESGWLFGQIHIGLGDPDIIYAVMAKGGVGVKVKKLSYPDLTPLAEVFITGISGAEQDSLRIHSGDGGYCYILDGGTKNLYKWNGSGPLQYLAYIGDAGNWVWGETQEPEHIVANDSTMMAVNVPDIGGSAGVTRHNYLVKFNALSRQGEPLSEVASYFLDQAKIEPARYDVSELDDYVNGYAVSSLSSARDKLTQLQQAYWFDVIESEGKIKCPKRGKPAVATIHSEELIRESGPLISISKDGALEIPRSITVTSIDADSDYQPLTQQAQRTSTGTLTEAAIQLAIVLSPDEGRQAAETLINDSFAQSITFAFKLPRRYSYVEAGDTIDLIDDYSDQVYSLRIVTIDEGSGMACTAHLDDVSLYERTATGSPGGGTAAPPPTFSGLVHLELFDCAALRQADDSDGYYAAACGLYSGYNGSALLRADSTGSLQQIAQLRTAASIGITNNALRNWNGSNIYDNDSSLRVTMLNGDLSSCTEAQFLSGEKNVLIVGDEIVIFRYATQIDAITWDLTTFLRARNGTDWASSGHAPGERVVLLTGPGIYRISADQGLITSERNHRAVSYGQLVGDAIDVPFTYRGYAIKPLSPSALTVSDTGSNIVASWIRRGRFLYDWFSGAPLDETFERYRVSYYDDSTLISQQVVDATTTITLPRPVSAGSHTLKIVVAQISSRVGDGWPSEKTINITV